MTYRGKYEAEAYQLSKENIQEMAAWTKWSHIGKHHNVDEQYLYNKDRRCVIGQYIVRQSYTGNEEFYILSEGQFIQYLTKINQ